MQNTKMKSEIPSYQNNYFYSPRRSLVRSRCCSRQAISKDKLNHQMIPLISKSNKGGCFKVIKSPRYFEDTKASIRIPMDIFKTQDQ